MTNTFNDIRHSKSILIIGGNPADAHPVSMLHVLNGRENGARMIVVDPRLTRTAHADEYVRIRPGADIHVGLVREIFANGWEDAQFIESRVYGMDQIRAEVEKWTPRRSSASAASRRHHGRGLRLGHQLLARGAVAREGVRTALRIQDRLRNYQPSRPRARLRRRDVQAYRGRERRARGRVHPRRAQPRVLDDRLYRARAPSG